MPTFDDTVAEFVAAPKVATSAPRWRFKNHPEFAEARMRVVTTDSGRRGVMILTSHMIRIPRKFSIFLFFRRARVLALDVNPGHVHRNLLKPEKVNGTHWQRWPVMEAERDLRDQSFQLWLADFFEAANVSCKFRVASPPQGVQLGLKL